MLPNPTEAPAADSTKPSLPEKVLLDSFDFMFSPISYSHECLAGCGAAKYFRSGPLFYYSGIAKQVQSYLFAVCLHRAIPGFFRLYDPIFAPQETLITMDYPVLNRDVSLCGVRAVQAYLDGLELEQEFLHLFPESLAVCME